jgi:hypothetical protein
METALRVLTAINRKGHPDPADIDILRAYAGPQREGISVDEFACEVIQKALKSRAVARAATPE